MTNERAIELLHRISDSQFDGIHGDERREALSMAVRALFSQQIFNDSQGLVNDCISRKMAIDALTRKSTQLHGLHWGDHPEAPHIESGVLSSIEIIRELPSAQPEPSQVARDICTILENEQDMRVILKYAQPERKKGRWLPDNNCYYETRYMCSECKLPFHVETIMMKPSWRFCPNCGARMDGEANDS